jgi:putative heme-binding domain-containing protein
MRTSLIRVIPVIPSAILVGLAIVSVHSQAVLYAQSQAPKASDFAVQEPSTAAAIYGQTIRETEARTPSEELAGFHVPAGFRVELVASEPTIAKPMNLAFDARGRLWVTQSTHYPYPAASDAKGLDAVVVLEDGDRDGQFEASRVFADQLNIPIGVLPYGDGALCFSIPNILYLRDTDGDGRCDRRDVVLGPFDTSRDTHGMINSLRMGVDGWVYACHGFNNQSEVSGSDGHTIKMNSGNVFRFRPDGSRVELYTQGQVNPFGMSQDRFGFWYAADCHSKPISQLIRGGCYPSFGRPDDGLGFVPPMMEHLHGSTAIAGLAHTKDSRFPRVMQDQFLSGNVMTCRVNRNRIEYRGATAKAIEAPDLLTSEDPWFRPVDLQFGPDGHLYIADFYNKVIGHYEVPLDHPGRDRRRGRIWRVRWEGGDTIQPANPPNTGSNSPSQLIRRLSSVNSLDLLSSLRMLATILSRPDAPSLDEQDFVHLMVCANGLDPKRSDHAIALRSIAEIVSLPYADSIESRATWLLRQADRIDETNDPVLAQSLRIALRQILIQLDGMDATRFAHWIDVQSGKSSVGVTESPRASNPMLAQVLIAMKRPSASRGLLRLLESQASLADQSDKDKKAIQELLVRLSDVIEVADSERFLNLVAATAKDAQVFSEQLLRIAQRQKTQSGQVSDSVRKRGQELLVELARGWLEGSKSNVAGRPGNELIAWRGVSLQKLDDRRDWVIEKRNARASQSELMPLSLWSSFPLGEAYVGTWTSSPFAAPDSLQFYLAGHNGLPQKEDHKKNFVQLVALDEAGNEINEIIRAFPPRNDVATKINWDLKQYRGARVVLRMVDGDNAGSYAWLAAGQFSLEGLNQGPRRKHWERIVLFASILGWPTQPDSEALLDQLLTDKNMDWQHRFPLSRLRETGNTAPFLNMIEFAAEKNWFDLLNSLGQNFLEASQWKWSSYDEAARSAFAESVMKRCSSKEQERLVTRLSKHRDAGQWIAMLVAKGALSRDALRVLPNSYWESIAGDTSHPLAGLKPEPSSPSDRLAIVESKAAAIGMLRADVGVGEKLFTERCALCHKLGQVGKVVGPQLEGIGARGIERLCEDILWPDRNVDEAFRMTLLVLDGGETISGLVSDRNADSLLLTDQQGKQRRILISEIEQEKRSKLSLMPGNFEETMTSQDLASLIGYLRQSIGPKKP